MIDTGGSVVVGEALLAAVRQVSDLPVSHVFNTHMHPDHTFGNAAFRGSGPDGGDPTFVGHRKLADALAARATHYLESNAPPSWRGGDRARRDRAARRGDRGGGQLRPRQP